jgi:tetratricopeptide (TPR) repeat protein
MAARALAAAADVALGRFDLAEAEDRLSEAVALDPTPGFLVQRGRVRLARADLDGADADGLAAEEAGGGAEALDLRAWVARFRHDMPTAIELGEEGARTAIEPLTTASCLIAVAIAHRGLGDLRQAEVRLEDARALDPEGRLGEDGWVGFLRVHQGRPAEALTLLEPAAGQEVALIHGFWMEHVLQMVAHASALTGRVADAWATLDRLDREMARRGSDARYAGLSDNYRCWILRSLADPSAGDHAERALEVIRMSELRAQSALELADALFLAGRIDDASRPLAITDEVMAGRWFQHRWRSEQRLGILRANLALEDGRPDDAVGLAAEVEAMATERGDARYAVLGRLTVARARARAGESVDPDAVAADLDRLPELAAPESWRLTAWTARDLRVDPWWARAEDCVQRLASDLERHPAGIGDTDAEVFRRRARVWLDDLRAAGP